MRGFLLIALVACVGTDSSAVGYAATIGAVNASAECLDGDIAEIVIANTGLSGADTTNLEAYFKAKYAL